MPNTTILFPGNPTSPFKPEPAYEEEALAAMTVGFSAAYLDTEAMLGGEINIRRLQEGPGQVLYRGWLIKPDLYLALEKKLKSLGWELTTSYEQYRDAYEFPRWYSKLSIQDWTPRSFWIERPGLGDSYDLDAVAKRVADSFGGLPCMVKDYVKSRKHEWFDACFIQDSRDATEVKRVVSNLIRLQGDDFYGGLVFREFVEFKKVGVHPKSKLPLIREWRTFYWNGIALCSSAYWKDGVQEKMPPLNKFWMLLMGGEVQKMGFRFVAVDSAELEDGGGHQLM